MLGFHLDSFEIYATARKRDKEALVVSPVRIGDEDEYENSSTSPIAQYWYYMQSTGQ